jgi:hypothetical protein
MHCGKQGMALMMMQKTYGKDGSQLLVESQVMAGFGWLSKNTQCRKRRPALQTRVKLTPNPARYYSPPTTTIAGAVLSTALAQLSQEPVLIRSCIPFTVGKHSTIGVDYRVNAWENRGEPV